MNHRRFIGFSALLLAAVLLVAREVFSWIFQNWLNSTVPASWADYQLPSTNIIAAAILVVIGLVVLLWPRIERMLGWDRIETGLLLRVYPPPNFPKEESQSNLWHWYWGVSILEAVHPDGSKRQFATIQLVWLFDKPTNYRDVSIVGKNMILPNHEVKQRTRRHVVIIFDSYVPPGDLELRLVL